MPLLIAFSQGVSFVIKDRIYTRTQRGSRNNFLNSNSNLDKLQRILLSESFNQNVKVVVPKNTKVLDAKKSQITYRPTFIPYRDNKGSVFSTLCS